MGSNPQLGFSARLVDSSTGAILWSEYASATGDDFTTLLVLDIAFHERVAAGSCGQGICVIQYSPLESFQEHIELPLCLS
jgi:hypothetical protein